ncbi:MAG: DUF1385 domain-containing protein [Lachnospiraceae bacterium]|nr:DUF1385 domain-containing protein [Lachnospiraceae bacterium]
MRYSGIGGQAVMEGVMMKNRDEYAVAVRKPDGNIEIKKEMYKSLREKYRIADVPVIRGVVTFAESLMIGVRTLNYSASFFEEEEEKSDKTKKQKEKAEQTDENKDEKKENILMGLAMVVAIVAAIGIFVLLPFFISEALRKPIPSVQLRGLLEGVIRVALFIAYVKLITLLDDIKRVFMYHGAEHKSISCVENGCELTVENVRGQSMVHKRCGTSFMLIVMFVSILFFMFISVGNIWLRMLLRIFLIPVIAGVAYECIRYAGSNDNEVIRILSKPGLWLQSLTTAEPTDDMIEVAIASVEAVFDWKEFIAKVEEAEETETAPADGEAVAEATTSEEAVSAETAAAESKPEKKRVPKKKAASTEHTPSQDIEILNIDDEEDDEILNALDRYFEAPEVKDDKK